MADPAGGGEDRAVLARLLRDPVLRGVRARHSRSRSRSCSGATPGSGCRWSAATLAAVAVVSNGTPEQIGEWCPQMFGDAGRRQARRVLLIGARRRQRRGRDPHPGRLRRGARRVGHQRRQDLGDQRRHRERARRRRLGRPGARLARPGDASSCRRRRQGLSQGQKFRKHGIRASHTAEVILDDVRVPGPLPGRRQGEAGPPAGPGPRGRPRRRAGGDEDVRGVPPVGRRDGRRRRPRRRRVRGGVRADPRAVRQADRAEPGRRVPARRHGRRRSTRPGC